MRCPLPLNVLALSLALGVAGTASAATPAQLAELLKQLTERVNKLEAANTQLQHELAASRSTPSATQTAAPTLRLEQRPAGAGATANPAGRQPGARHHQRERAELSTRLKAVEAKTQELSAPVAKLKSLDGVKTSVSLTMVAQQPLAATCPTASSATEPTRRSASPGASGRYRARPVCTLSSGTRHGTTGLPSTHGNPNATAFQVNGLGSTHRWHYWRRLATRPASHCPWVVSNEIRARRWKSPWARSTSCLL